MKSKITPKNSQYCKYLNGYINIYKQVEVSNIQIFTTISANDSVDKLIVNTSN